VRPPPRPQRVASVRPERVHAPAPPGVRAPSAAKARGAETTHPTGNGVVPPTSPADPVDRAAAGRALTVPVRRPTVVAGSAERFAERAEMRRRLSRRRVWGAVGAVVVAAVAGWVLFWSPVLALDVAEVEVQGQGSVVDPAALLAVVQPKDETPLPRLDTVELRRAILDVPGVRAAEVVRVWPHGLRVTVVSREPVAAVPAEEGFVLLDVEGVQVGRAGEPPVGLPVISVPVDDEDARAMTAVLTVLQQLPTELAVQVASASAGSQDTVRLVLTDGAKVEWGSADQNALKARVVQTLRNAEASRDAAVFDVSAPTTPITRTQ